MRIRGFFLFRRYTILAFIILLLLSTLIIMSLRVKQRKGIDFFDALLMEGSAPFQKASTFVIKSIRGVFQGYIFLIRLQKENGMLKQRVDELQKENHQIKEMALANERLQKLLQFREKNSPAMVAAEVIGQDPSSWFKSVTIDKRQRDGLRKGIAVISPEGVIGQVRLVYANFDDGMIAPKMSPWFWRDESGVPWPAKDEFEVGCTYEHAGYILTWLAAFFGPALNVTAFASCQIPDKGLPVDSMAPDFSVGCIEYAEGIVARVTCSLVAPKDRSLVIIGDDGIIFTENVRNDAAPVFIRKIPPSRMQRAIECRLNRLLRCLKPAGAKDDWHFRRKYPFARRPAGRFVSPSKPVDFCRGPAEMAEAIRQKRSCRLSARLGLHMVELIETLQYPKRFGGRRTIKSKFDALQPLPWHS
jgi:predicted dehydrogenase